MKQIAMTHQTRMRKIAVSVGLFEKLRITQEFEALYRAEKSGEKSVTKASEILNIAW